MQKIVNRTTEEKRNGLVVGRMGHYVIVNAASTVTCGGRGGKRGKKERTKKKSDNKRTLT